MATASKIMGVTASTASKVCGVAKSSVKYVMGVQFAEVLTGYGSNVLVGGTPSASSEYGAGNLAAKAFDGNTSSYWMTSTVNSGILTYDIGTAKRLRKCTLSASELGQVPGSLKTFTIQGSSNGSSWTTVSSVTTGSWSAYESRDFTFENPTAYRYWRINCTEVQNSAYLLAISEWTGYEGVYS